MRDQGIGSWIERRARIAPERRALIFGERSLTYAELAGRIRRLADGLRTLGVRHGDRVGWIGPNHPVFIETLFASAKLGAILAPVNHRLAPTAMWGILEDAGPRVVMLASSFAQMALPSPVEARIVVECDGDGSAYEDLLRRSSAEPIDEPVAFEDVCLLPYTSGTTSSPKGVMLTHANVTWNVINLLSCADFRGGDTTVAVAPFFRTGGTGVNVLPVLFQGGTVAIPSSSDADEILRLIERHRVTVGFANPDLLEALTHSSRWASADFEHLRFIITGGAPVPERLIRVCSQRDVTLLQGYGLSEAAPVVALLDQKSALAKVGSAGKPVLLVEIRVVRQDGTDCRTNETGELLVRGPNVMAGYFNRPDATRSAVERDGWLHTGDAARIDEDGDLWIVDRLRDGYIIDGEPVFPGDIERVLMRDPGVADVGVVDVERRGKRETVAFVVRGEGSKVTAAELLELCRISLAPHQRPGALQFVDEVPRSTVGKLLRGELRAIADGGRVG